MDELEKAKLLSVATKLAKAEIEEARSQLIEQINSIQVKDGRDGRSIVDARIFEGQLTLQFSDGSIANLGQVVGTSGLTGATGAKGDKGDPGEAGPPGARGDTGLTGPAGKDGERGPRGDKGDKGDTGPKGEKGDQGERGEKGEQGAPGERGERGERGEQGPQGIAGTNGRDGRDGAEGKTGARGPQGVPGRDGKDGKDGEVGPQGPKGDKGDKGDPGSDADVSKLEKKLEQFTEEVDRRISKVAFNAATGGGPAGSGEVWLHKLEDVDYNIKNASDGQALVWNASLGKWQANTISGGGGGFGPTSSSLTVSKVLTNGSYANSVSNVTGLRFDDDSGFDVVDLGSGNVKVQMNSTFKYWKVNGALELTATGLDTVDFIAGSGISIVGNTAGKSLTISSNLNLNPYLQVSNANAKFATKAYAAANSYVKAVLANTNAYIASKVNSTTFNSALANTNAFIKSQLANTNAYIASKASWSALTSTNTAIRTLVSNRLQVANAAATYQTKAGLSANVAALTSNNSLYLGGIAANQYAYANTTYSTISWINPSPGPASPFSTLVKAESGKASITLTTGLPGFGSIYNWSFDTTKITFPDSTTQTTAFTGNANNASYLGGIAAAQYATKAYAAANSYVKSTLANTNLYIAQKMSVANTKLYLANTNAFIKAQLANTNAYISSRATWSALTSTNTAIRNYVDTKVAAVVNAAPGALDTLYELAAALNNDASFAVTVTNLIGTKISVANTKAYLANTNAFIKSQLANTNAYISTRATWASITGTNTAIRALVSDRLQVSNAAAIYQTKAVERAALANTNAFIKTQLANTNAYIATKISNAVSTTIQTRNIIPETDVTYNLGSPTRRFKTLYISGNTIALGTANLSSTGSTLKVGSQVLATNSYLTSTYIANTTARSLINDRLQVANAKSYMQVSNTKAYLANTNSFVKAQLANTNSYIATRASWTELKATNTAIRTLVSDRLQIANAVATYQTKTVERAALANTNAYIGAQATRITLVNTNLLGTNTALRTLVNDRLQVANATATYQTKTVERAALANTNAYIATRASWTELKATNTAIRALISGSSGANGFSGILVGSNVVVADSTTDRLTFVAGSGITISANPTTDTITFTSTGGGTISGTTANVQTKIIKDLTENDTVVTSVVGLLYPSANVVTKALNSIKGSDQVVTSVTGLLAQMTPYLQVSNATSLLATKATWTELKATNTAIRALDTAKLSVANAVSTYATKTSPTTSGLLAHTGRATISTNLAVSGNTSLSGLVNLDYTGSANSTLAIRGTNTKGGTGYHDFLMVRNGGGGVTNPTKWFRLGSTGSIEILNSAYSGIIFALSDSGSLTLPQRHAFRVYGNGTTNNLTTTQNGDGKLTNSNFAVDYNQGGTLHANTGVFTARSGGLYQICLNVRNAGYSSGISQAIVYKNKGVAGEAVMVMIEFGSSSSMNHAGGSTVASLSAGDTLSLRVGAGQINFDGNDNWSVTHIG